MFYNLKEILGKKGLIRELVIKDLKVRYAKSALGFFWTFLSPLLVTAVLYLVFSLILKIKTEELPFFLYLMSAVFSWRFFQDSLICSTTCLVDNRNLIKESGFKHYLIPISIVLTNTIIFFPSLFLMIIVSLLFLNGLPPLIIFLPVVLTLHLITAIGLSIAASVLYVRWRDIKHILEVALFLLFYLTPAFYPMLLVRDSFPAAVFKTYTYNPFVGILSLYRAVIFKGFYSSIHRDIGYFSLIVIPVIFAVLVLWLGFYYYGRNKDTINDYLSY